ncbi:hypothetical protein GGTG_02003 [Gaeumannomyces tritici R3-111a-1]|uniref:Checkpoint protein RAD24-like helical bundle domain-containing protein n=1 Tax=Gaeumannomyces tritici (strain R3-111a-1) TaxID=644352 RepID=J3NL62_GAET3|nr:hypothetical protein GGTG_02003 [Gaeumannomyces tritici R3-111a-1]EJT82029.1 hypothetical protein GGTG_02003 [Gaeumannomyces tritici R3-111a-1]
MAPPARRRKRNLVESDDDDDAPPQPQSQQTTPRKNSLKNFLIPSPKKPSAVDPQTTKPPSPKRRTTTRSATAAAAAASKKATSNGASVAAAAPPSFLNNRGRGSKASTKSPSASPEKRGKKTKVSEEKGRNGDLLLLFSKQAQRATKTDPKPSTPIDDIISDPISGDDDNVAESKAAVVSIVGKNAVKRFRDGGNTGSSQQHHGAPPSSSLPPSTAASNMFRKPPRLANGTLGGSAVGNSTGEDLRPWSERFGPANLEELAVHKKKVADVRRWLENVMDGRMRQRLLVLKGAAGSGKTTTVQFLAKELRCEVLEWRNPTSSYGAPGQRYQSAAAQFEEFMGRGGRFGQLDLEDDDGSPAPLPRRPAGGSASDSQTDAHTRRLMLVEEFPNTFMRSSSALTSFRSAVLQFLATNTPSLVTFGHQTQQEPAIPVVMVISETLLTTTSASADSFTAHRLLGPEILRHPGTGIIEFNAIAPTFLLKALELVVQKEARKSGRRRTPGPMVLKKLGEIGDIRNAISSLEFLCLKGDTDADWGAKVTFTKPKKGAREAAMTKGERESLELVSQREASLGIFHAVGKVVYNRRDDIPYAPGTLGYEVENLPRYMSRHSRPKQSLVSVDTLIDETGTDTSTFISALHENYALSCEATGPHDFNSAVDYMNGCLDFLSDSDLLCPSWDIFFGGRGGSNYYGRDVGSHVLRQDEMAFEVAVRGMLFSLPSPVKRQSANSNPRNGSSGDQYKMFFPTSIKLWRAKEELEALMDMWSTRIVSGEEGFSGGGGAVSKGAGHQSLSSSASAFRKPRPIGGSSGGSSVGDWATNRTDLKRGPATAEKEENEEEESTAPLLSLGSSARKEMLLDRLPYMAHMARKRRGSFLAVGLRDLERVVSFQGIGSQAMADEDEAAQGEDEDVAGGGGGVPGESWATDRPTEESASPRKRRVNNAIRPKRAVPARGGGGGQYDGDDGLIPGGLQVQKLMLSDDEIEDD